MYSITNDTKWSDRAQQLWNTSTQVFFTVNPPKVMTEVACESNTPVNCDTDQLSFKASFSRFLGASTKLMPSLYDQVMPYLAASANAAAAQCTGNPGGDSCGTLWFNNGKWVSRSHFLLFPKLTHSRTEQQASVKTCLHSRSSNGISCSTLIRSTRILLVVPAKVILRLERVARTMGRSHWHPSLLAIVRELAS